MRETTTSIAGASSSEGGISDACLSLESGERHDGATPTITVVVTFFNIEELYLRRCVDSLLNQSDDQFELLLVDDGSTDGKTPAMLDEYDGRNGVRVLHKENGGPGDARNYGARLASGEYVSFVDGDDFVSPYYVSLLRRTQRETGANFIIGVHEVVPSNLNPSEVLWGQNLSACVLSRDEAIRKLLIEEMSEGPCCKLAPRMLYLKHPMPRNVYYEDVAIAGTHYLSASEIAQLKTPIYAYVMRVGSVVHRREATIKQARDFEAAIESFLSPIRLAYPRLKRELAYREALELARLHSVLRMVVDDRPAAVAMDNNLIDTLREDVKIASLPVTPQNSDSAEEDGVEMGRSLPRTNMLRFRLLSTFPGFYDVLFSCFEAFKKNIRRS